MIIVDHSFNPVLELDDMKVDQQAHLKIEQSQVRQQLRLVDGMECLFPSDLDHDPALHDQIGAKSALQLYCFIYQWNGLLSLYMQSQLLKFIGETAS
jgi:hypothetical protein